MDKFKLTQLQTDHILDMPLKRLTALEKRKLEEEQSELKKAITGFNTLLKSDTRQKTLVIKELDELVKQLSIAIELVVVTEKNRIVENNTEIIFFILFIVFPPLICKQKVNYSIELNAI